VVQFFSLQVVIYEDVNTFYKSQSPCFPRFLVAD